MNIPKVSVITVVYNAVDVLEKTIQSVINQGYSPLEFIIIDGGSTDGTVEIIKKYENRISYWVSEPDKGIYDAMNKGIGVASGDWINFMNAGDHFYSSTIISDIFDSGVKYDNYSVVYGKAEFRLKTISYIKPIRKTDSDHFMPFSHQAAFVKSEVAKKNKFDLTYKITADTEFFLRINRQGSAFCDIPVVVCSYNAMEGVSMDNEVKRVREMIQMHIQYGAPENARYFKTYIRDAYKMHYMRKCVPAWIWIKLKERTIKKQTGWEIKFLKQ